MDTDDEAVDDPVDVNWTAEAQGNLLLQKYSIIYMTNEKHTELFFFQLAIAQCLKEQK